jgi:hypothetical protein
MSIPLDRLYHFINNVAGETYGGRVIIYRFFPHGSKNIEDLNNLDNLRNDWYEKIIFPSIWCHDQEPLNYKFYKINRRQHSDKFNELLKSLGEYFPPNNLNHRTNIFKKNLLVHSEKRSNNLKKYQADNELIPVYYWSHAVIAQDWFRYARYETFQKNIQKTFLIYNRAWSGTREYRLRFSDLLIERNLINQCQTSNNPVDPELNIHYTNHTFTNPQWKPIHVLEDFLQPTTADATSSADFDATDYRATDIEVVLETLFDDNRLHLTEKSLRPIACSQPFILAGTHGSLEYLRGYGFKTFSTVWDESYDQIVDSEERLTTIVDLMQQISAWDESTKKNKLLQAQEIAAYNQQWFFSQNFFDLVVNELKTNFKSAFEELEKCDNYKTWFDRLTHLMSYPEIIEYLKTNQNSILPIEIDGPTMDSVNQAMLLVQNRLVEIANKNKI